ncbi:MAG: DNA-methyltransferase [Candidatus Methanofastidiosia archaeon]
MNVWYKILEEDCLKWFDKYSGENIHLTFIDPPFRQGKDYRFFDDNQPEERYWNWLKDVLSKVYEITDKGGAVYFMQREKNTENVLRLLRDTGWAFQNLIIWKKKTSAIPSEIRYSKQYQIIAFSTKGKKPRVFNKLRVDLTKPPEYKYERPNGVYVTDVWDDIRELTSGYFAGDEAIRDKKGTRIHTQQSPIALLLRIVLTSTLPGDLVLDPFAGTGTTAVVVYQLKRKSICIEIDPEYVKIIKRRLNHLRSADDISKSYDYYKYTKNLKDIWPTEKTSTITEQKRLF